MLWFSYWKLLLKKISVPLIISFVCLLTFKIFLQTIKQNAKQNDLSYIPHKVKKIEQHSMFYKKVTDKKTQDIETEREATSHPIPTNPKIIYGNTKICQKANLKYIIYVHSAPKNNVRRNNLRHTWANSTLFKDGRSQVVFFFGIPTQSDQQKIIEYENKIYADIVQGDFLETYNNLTYKGIMALRYIVEYCSHVKYVLKADDDTLLDIFHVMEVFEATEQNEHKNIVVCPVYEGNMPILRDPKTCMKWCINEDEFPGKDMYPQYCAGIFYGVTFPIAKAMYKASTKTPFFWIDDVYISGLLIGKAAKEIPTKYVNLEFKFYSEKVFESFKNKTGYNVHVTHLSNSETYSKVWKYIIHNQPQSTLKQLNL